MGYVFNLDVPFLFKLIERAIESEREDRIHDRYCAMLPYLDKEYARNFDKYKELYKPKETYHDSRSDDELLEDLLGGLNNGTI